MKRIITLIVSAALLVTLFAGCSANDKTDVAAQTAAAQTTVSAEMPTLINTAEYTLYQNIFYNDMKKDYAGKEVTKEGTFTTLHDAFNDTVRYYVWGYNDQTKCCDWQWELKVDDTSSLPSNGSLVTVSGVYEENEDALDKFWIVNPVVTVKTAYQGESCDINMLTMGGTLERVQAQNIVYKKEAFEDKSVRCYGRILNESTLEDPYYDNSWTIGIAGDFDLPAFGTLVELEGTVSDGALIECSISENTQY